MKTSVIEVHDMLSVLTVDEVEKRIGEVPGVESATVNYAARNATVRYDETLFNVADIKVIVHQRGKQSAGDGRQDKQAPNTPPSATAEPKPQMNVSVAAPAPITPAANGHESHKDHGDHAAHGAHPPMSADMAHEMGHNGTDMAAMVRDMRNRFWICLVFTVPIFVYAPMGGMFKPPAPPFGLDINLWLLFFSSAAVLYPSWPFFVSAWRALLKGTLGMATLIVLSVGTGYLFSVGSTLFFKESGQFFEAVSVLLVFILLGHWLEMRARAGASSAIKALMNLTPTKANVFRNGAEVEVPTAKVLAGEIVVIRPGNKIPVDGTIETGESLVDESMLTGESMRVQKGLGATVIGATINKSGSFRYKATKVGADSALAQIVKLVQEAQNSKAPAQLLADKAAQWLVIDKTAPGWPSSIAATGLALACYPVSVERGFMSRAARSGPGAGRRAAGHHARAATQPRCTHTHVAPPGQDHRLWHHHDGRHARRSVLRIANRNDGARSDLGVYHLCAVPVLQRLQRPRRDRFLIQPAFL